MVAFAVFHLGSMKKKKEEEEEGEREGEEKKEKKERLTAYFVPVDTFFL